MRRGAFETRARHLNITHGALGVYVSLELTVELVLKEYSLRVGCFVDGNRSCERLA